MQHNSAIVFDQGAHTLLVGLAGQQPSLLRVERIPGQQEERKRGVLDIKHPPLEGIIQNWDEIEKHLHRSFYDVLQLAPENRRVLLSEPILNKCQNRQKLVQMLFETFDVGSLALKNAPALALLSSGRVTGLSLHVGYSHTQVAAIFDGYSMAHTSHKNEVAGKWITEQLCQLLSKYSLTQQQIAEIRESLSYESNKHKHCYQLPDGCQIEMPELQHLPEQFFKPASAQRSVPELTERSIRSCDLDLQEAMRRNVVVSGGTSLMHGFGGRLGWELNGQVKVVMAESGQRAVWDGASMHAHHCGFVTKQDYDEHGPAVVSVKCL